MNNITNRDLRNKVTKIVESNITEIPYEGKEVNKYAIIDEVCELISSMLTTQQTTKTTDQ